MPSSASSRTLRALLLATGLILLSSAGFQSAAAATKLEANAANSRKHRSLSNSESNNYVMSAATSEEAPTFLEKRPQAPRFLGKRQQAPRFLGKRQSAPRFLGKRQYAPRFLGKRQYAPRFLGKRQYAPRFLGKRQSAPRFLGKRSSAQTKRPSAQTKRPYTPRKRPSAPRFLGKRQYAPRFLGKRQYAPRFLGKRQYAPRFLGKRPYAPRFLGKRQQAPRFIGKRSDEPRFLDKRQSAPRFLGKRQYAPRFLGKRQYEPRLLRKKSGKNKSSIQGPYLSAEEFIKAYRKSDPYFMGKRGLGLFDSDRAGQLSVVDIDDLTSQLGDDLTSQLGDDLTSQLGDDLTRSEADGISGDIGGGDDSSRIPYSFDDEFAPYFVERDDLPPAEALASSWDDIEPSSSNDKVNKMLKTDSSSEGKEFPDSLVFDSSNERAQR